MDVDVSVNEENSIVSKKQMKRLQKAKENESRRRELRHKERLRRKQSRIIRKLEGTFVCKPSRTILEEPSITVIFDLSFNQYMNAKEVSSLYNQLCKCYGCNRRTTHPVDMVFASGDSSVFEGLYKKMNAQNWKDLTILHQNWTDLLNDDKYSRCNFVYLTSDADDTLSVLEKDTTYIIGGLVDRNRHKGATYNIAGNYNSVRTMRLPLKEHLEFVGSPVLTVNQTFELLIKISEKVAWHEALNIVIPKRKIMDKQICQS